MRRGRGGSAEFYGWRLWARLSRWRSTQRALGALRTGGQCASVRFDVDSFDSAWRDVIVLGGVSSRGEELRRTLDGD